jgi:hypothetical protein
MVNLESAPLETALLVEDSRRVDEMKFKELYWLPVVLLLGCPLIEPIHQPLATGCSICPTGTICETTDSDAGAEPSVQCVPETVFFQRRSVEDTASGDASVESDSSGPLADSADGADAGSGTDSVVSSCSETGCPCTEDSDCSNGICGMLGGNTACTLSCPQGCVESDCPNACPEGWTCMTAGDGTALCWL